MDNEGIFYELSPFFSLDRLPIQPSLKECEKLDSDLVSKILNRASELKRSVEKTGDKVLAGELYDLYLRLVRIRRKDYKGG